MNLFGKQMKYLLERIFSNSICIVKNRVFFGNGSICEDIDECSHKMYTCSSNATCVNTYGSYICKCKDAYIGDGNICFLLLNGRFNNTSEYLIQEEFVESCFEAEERCKLVGGNLASFETENERNLVAETLHKEFAQLKYPMALRYMFLVCNKKNRL